MTYAESRAWLDSLGEFHMELGLDRVRSVLATLGHPEKGPPAVHVAGTNGKGMTCAYASSILRHAGKKVGLYTSPHLSRPNERIAIAGRPIDDEGFARAVGETRSASERSDVPLTYFEAMTVAAFVAFREAQVDARVIEVGLGGRLDATNVIEPSATVITTISFDHTAILGTSLASIAREKAGILKPGVPCLVGDLPAEALVAIQRHAESVKTTVSSHDPVAAAERLYLPAKDPVRGGAAALATLAIFSTGVMNDVGGPAIGGTLRRAIEDVAWPGRLEELHPPGGGPVLHDGGHNPGAARLLASMSPFGLGRGNRVLLFAAMADKDCRGILRELAGAGPTHAVCTSAGTARSATARMLGEDARAVFGDRVAVEAVEGVDAAYHRARELAGADGRLLVTGSLYLVGQVRELVTGGAPSAIG